MLFVHLADWSRKLSQPQVRSSGSFDESAQEALSFCSAFANSFRFEIDRDIDHIPAAETIR